MRWLREQLRQGVLGGGWTGLAISLLLAAGVYATSLLYDLLNHGPNRFFLRTALDQAMPVVPVFVVPYVSLNPLTYASLVFFLVFRTRLFRSAAVAMIAAFIISAAFFAFAQTYVARPVVGGDDLFSRMVRGVYASDQPYNDFPSLHVAVSTILAIHWWRHGRVTGWIAAVWAVLVIASTQLVHQHYLADVIGGLVLAFGVSLPALRYFDQRPSHGVVEAGARAGVAGGAGGGHG